jgi:hypothetical protein
MSLRHVFSQIQPRPSDRATEETLPRGHQWRDPTAVPAETGAKQTPPDGPGTHRGKSVTGHEQAG